MSNLAGRLAGDDFEEAFLKSLPSVGYRLPVKNILLSTGPSEAKAEFLPSTRKLQEMGRSSLAGSWKPCPGNPSPTSRPRAGASTAEGS
jgi:hypothetical protein